MYRSVEPSPSYRAGFARTREESAYPEFWDGLSLAVCPLLGPTGRILEELSAPGRNLCGVSNVGWSPSNDGMAMAFNGSNTSVSIGRPVLSGDFTILWYGTVAEKLNSIFAQRVAGSATRLDWTATPSAGLRPYFGGTALGQSAAFTANAPHVFVVRRSGSEWRQFLDGFSSGTTGSNANTVDQTNNTYLGTYDGVSGEATSGTLYACYAWSYPLTWQAIHRLSHDPLMPFRRRSKRAFVAAIWQTEKPYRIEVGQVFGAGAAIGGIGHAGATIGMTSGGNTLAGQCHG